MKGLYIPGITSEMFRHGCLESIESLMAEGEIYDIDYQLEQIRAEIEKDIPKAPKKSDTPRYGMGYEYYDWCCPSCGKFLAYECDYEREKIHHCRCGQRLKWESEDK